MALALGVSSLVVHAHKPITSKYTYNDDVFPILKAKCGQCHVEGGVAPMSLMTHEQAFPWAESIRAELIAGHMPPWNADEAFGDLKNPHTLTPKELDVILTWATGGNPQGDREKELPAVPLKNDWTLGRPDLALPLSEFAVAADRMEDAHEWTIATGTTADRWVRAVDLLPGTPSIVRSAVVFVKSPAAPARPGNATTETVLARWVPGRDAEPMTPGVALRLPAGAELGVRIHYKKTWQFEGKALSDRSTVGVYFAAAPAAQPLLAMPLATTAAAGADQTVTFSQTLSEDVQALALSPEQVPPNITVQVEAVRPDGSRAPLIRLNTRADWGRRYWFDKPVALPRGTRIEVTANLQDPDLLSAAFAAPSASPTAPRADAMRLMLNVIPATARSAAP